MNLADDGMTPEPLTDAIRSRHDRSRHGRPRYCHPGRGARARAATPALAAALAIALGGCQLTDETGFVEVKRQFAPPPTGVFRLNGEDIPGIATAGPAATTVVRQKTGAMRIDFIRDGQVYALCRFDLRKNRIVTVTLYLEAREIRCGVTG